MYLYGIPLVHTNVGIRMFCFVFFKVFVCIPICIPIKFNKAVYTATLVAGGWAGAVMSWAGAVMTIRVLKVKA